MGIPISIDPSWLIIFGVLTYELGTGVFPFELGLGRRRGLNLEALGLAFLTSLLFFLSVLLHELSHSWMAIKRGIPVLGITLFLFGGVAQIGDEADRPATEFLVAIMGPLMSFALAAVFAIFWVWPLALLHWFPASGREMIALSAVGSYLAVANAILVVFNLLPGFPMDGGRVLRALLWGITHDLKRSTRIAMIIGRGIAVLLVLFGLYSIVRVGLNGIWSLLMGAFLWNAAGEAYRGTLFREALKEANVGALMSVPIAGVPANLRLSSFVELYLMPHHGGVYTVQENGETVGLVGGGQLEHIPRDRWAGLKLGDVMLTPGHESVSPHDTALSVLSKMTRRPNQDDGDLAVIADGQMVGVIGHAEIARFMRAQELNRSSAT